MDFSNPAFSFFAAIGIAGALVLVVIAAFVIWAYAYTYMGLYRQGRRLMRSLRKQDRTISPEAAAQRYGRGEGIVIVEGPTLGWPIYRIWWSVDCAFLPQGTERVGDDFCAREDHMNYARFVDPDKGSAMLICPFVSGRRMKAYLNKHFGIVEDPFFIYTGGVLASREMRSLTSTSRG